MLYFFTLTLLAIMYITLAKVMVNVIFDNGWQVEIHFIFFSLNLSGKRKRGRYRVSIADIIGALDFILEKSTVTLKRLTVPVNSSPTLPNIKYLGVNISYPLIYAYLTARAQRLIISENAVTKETTENFRLLVNISLQSSLLNLLRAALRLLFATNIRKEA